jgi:acetaldehyde dehydrogenase (acetylating)
MLGMAAMFLQIGIGDVREDIIRLTLIHAVAQKVGIDPRSVFLESARQFGLEDTSGLEAYLNRSDEDKSLVSMGYVEGTDEDGLRFVRTW